MNARGLGRRAAGTVLSGFTMNDRPDTPSTLDRLILTLRRQVLMLKAIRFDLIGVVNAMVDFAVFLFALGYITPT